VKVLAVLALAASTVGGAGTITARAVGPLGLGSATQAQVRAFAGAPDRTWTARPDRLVANTLYVRGGAVWGYGCNRVDCATLYAFVRGKLIGLFTRGASFRTGGGSHVGTPLAQVLAHDGGKWSGVGAQCPGVLFAAPGTGLFKASIDPRTRRVESFFVSSSYPAVNDGC
jgi:hypothetical protein